MDGRRTRVMTLALAGAAGWVLMARGAASRPPEEGARYPPVTLSTTYQVDPSWPRRPAGVAWGEMPGVAVDAADRVWIFTRAMPPVQVYEPGGQFVEPTRQIVDGPAVGVIDSR